MAGPVITIPVDRIHLFEQNPRHGRITDPQKIINKLCKDEQVLDLARSIADRKTNPLELIGVVRIDDAEESGEPTYEVWEGNRRVCAIILLNDPDRAPSKWRKQFEELSKRVDPIEAIEGRVFDDHDELRFWMRNIHNGAQQGRGRKDWGPDEQHRDNPTRKNAIAFDLLERAEAKSLITRDQRSNSLTTLQRFVGSKHIRPILLADDSDPSFVKYGRPEKELLKINRVLMQDLKSGAISSRQNDKQIQAYAAQLEQRAGLAKPGVNGTPGNDSGVEAQPGDPKPYNVGGKPTAGGGSRPDPHPDDDRGDDQSEVVVTRPKPLAKIKAQRDLAAAIEESGNHKLASLYHSVVRVSAKDHTPLVLVGCWVLCETIARYCGAKDNQSFEHFFNVNYIKGLGIEAKPAKSMISCLNWIGEQGNTTKHHDVAATVDVKTLIMNMDVVSPLLAKALVAKAK